MNDEWHGQDLDLYLDEPMEKIKTLFEFSSRDPLFYEKIDKKPLDEMLDDILNESSDDDDDDKKIWQESDITNFEVDKEEGSSNKIVRDNLLSFLKSGKAYLEYQGKLDEAEEILKFWNTGNHNDIYEMSKNKYNNALERLKEYKEIFDSNYEVLTKSTAGNRYIVKLKYPDDSERYYTLSDDFIRSLYKYFGEIVNSIYHVYEEVSGSDMEIVRIIEEFPDEFDKIDEYIADVITLDGKRKNNGAYFKYSHKSPLNLEKLQIIKNSDNEETYFRVTSNHCLVNSIDMSLKDSKRKRGFLHFLKFKIGCNQYKSSDISQLLPDWLRLRIRIYNDDMTLKSGWNKFYMNKNSRKNTSLIEETAEIFLYKEHYMPVINIVGGVKCIKEAEKYDPNMTVDSRVVIRELYKNNLLEPCKYNHFRNIDMSEHHLNEFTMYNNQHKTKNFEEKTKEMYNVYADFESIVYNEKEHVPFMHGYCVDEDDNVRYLNSTNDKDLDESLIVTRFLDKLCKDKPDIKEFRIYYHNLKYDFTFFKKCRFINILRELNKSGQVYSATISYNRRKFTLVDSYKVIPIALGRFKKTFNLTDCGKMNFNYYNIIDRTNFNKSYVPFKYFLKLMKERENKTFTKEEIKTNFSKYLINKNNVLYYNHTGHYKEYLEYDCLTLKKGIRVFNLLIEKITGLSVYNSITISSLAFKYILKKKCYDDTYAMSGDLQMYSYKAVAGGRVCVLNNEKIIVDGEIVDFDGVSLYPSAMSIVVIPKGECEIIRTNDYDELQKIYSQYIVTCRIKVNKKQQIPALSYMVDGVRKWTNEISPDKEITVDKTTLEDLKMMHDIDILEISSGIGWDIKNGVNLKINKVISKVFQSRLEAKANKNDAMSEILKLLMNSSYGKNLLKDSETTLKYIKGGYKLKNYLFNNYNQIKKVEPLDKNDDKNTSFRVTYKKSHIGNINYAHIGCFILSMARRIMNEIFYIANENKYPIYYTDTDSMFLNKKDVPKLEKLYKEKYGRELIGKNLRQFHTDLESQKLCPDGNYKDLYCSRFIGLGKKCYLAILQHPDRPGEIDYHIRFKGATKINILNYCEEKNITVEEFYLKLYNGEPIELDICSGKVRFVFDSNKVSTRTKYLKTFRF